MGSSRITTSRSTSVLGQPVSQWSYGLQRWLYVGVLLSVISLLAFVYLTQASHVARQTAEMEGSEELLHDLKKRNNSLLLRIAQYEQMSRVKQEARALGLGEPERVAYVEVLVDEDTAPSDAPFAPQGRRPLTGGRTAVEPPGPTPERTGRSGPGAPLGSEAARATEPVAQMPGWLNMIVTQFTDWINTGAARAAQPGT